MRSRFSALLFGSALCMYSAPAVVLAPPEPPTINKPHSGERTIEGLARDAKHQIRVKVFGESGEVQRRDVLVDPQDNTFGAVLKAPLTDGEIVQAFLLVNGAETAPSIPVAVAVIAPVAVISQSAAPPVATAARATVQATLLEKDAFMATVLPAKNAIAEAGTSDSSAAAAQSRSSDTAPPEVELTATPKEGQKTIYVSAPPAGDTKYSLAVMVNGEQVRVIDSSGNETDSVPTGSTGSTSVQLKDPLDGGQCVQALEFETGKQFVASKTLGCGDTNETDKKTYYASNPRTVTAFFDYGRIRSYLVAGSLLSYDGGSFSQPSVFLALNANRNWVWGGITQKTVGSTVVEKKRRFMFDTFFEARLTTVPTAACSQTGTQTSSTTAPAGQAQGTTTSMTTAANGCSGQQTSTTSGTTTTTTSPTLQSVLSSPKAGELLAGVSLPYLLTTWKHGSDPYGFTFGPIAKVGFLTPVGSQNSTTTTVVNPQSFYVNYGFGARFGFDKLSYVKEGDSKDVAPETVSYIDVVSGKYSNFDFNPNPDTRYSRPWRFAFEGLLKLPATPFFLGFSANVHQNFGLGNSTTVDHARDDLRFLFGAKFDAGKLFGAVQQIK